MKMGDSENKEIAEKIAGDAYAFAYERGKTVIASEAKQSLRLKAEIASGTGILPVIHRQARRLSHHSLLAMTKKRQLPHV